MATRNPAPGTCMVQIYEDNPWSYHGGPKYCGRPVKGQGVQSGSDLCGVHLRAEQANKDREDARTARLRRSREVGDRLGIATSAINEGHRAGMLAVYPASLMKLADRLEAMEAALGVLTSDPAILAWLEEHDPQALKQARAALGEEVAA